MLNVNNEHTFSHGACFLRMVVVFDSAGLRGYGQGVEREGGQGDVTPLSLWKICVSFLKERKQSTFLTAEGCCIAE